MILILLELIVLIRSFQTLRLQNGGSMLLLIMVHQWMISSPQ